MGLGAWSFHIYSPNVLYTLNSIYFNLFQPKSNYIPFFLIVLSFLQLLLSSHPAPSQNTLPVAVR